MGTVHVRSMNVFLAGILLILAASAVRARAGDLPNPWQQTDVGSPGIPGTASYVDPAFTIEGSGYDIWGTADQFCFVCQPLNGDGTIIARVASVENTHWWAKAGVMIRESLTTGSKECSMIVSASCGLAFQWRDTTDNGTTDAEIGGGAPLYVKLQRIGDNFSAYQSADGSSWTQVGSTQSVSMASSAYVGLCVCSHDNNALCTGVLDHVSVDTGPSNDTTAPAAVSNLATDNPTSSSIRLTWTAPGDDGSTGTATGYDIRYRTDAAVDESNWASAMQATGEPNPQTTGTNQSMTVTGLSASTTYYFAIKTLDEASNASAISNSPSGTTAAPDTAAPAAVSSLATSSPTSNSITLTWTAPGDDGSTGTAASYDIRYSTAAINEGNWASAIQVTGEPAPAVAGTNQNMIVSGLSASMTYYFAIKTSDETPNTSAISNSPNGTTGPVGPSGIIALKRDSGLAAGGAIDARFNTAAVTITTVHDTELPHQQDSRWASPGRAPVVLGSYALYKFDLSAVPALQYAHINLAQLRVYNGNGNNGGHVGMVLTHDWIEGPGVQFWECPGAAGGVSWAHPIGYNTAPNQNASGGTTPPLQSWGYNSDSLFDLSVDLGPMQVPSSAPSGAGYTVINVTSHVQAWVSNVRPNYGWGQDVGNYTPRMSEAGTDLQPVLFIDYSLAGDGTPPPAVANLAAGSATSSSLTVTWTAPGDDGSTGTAASYDLRYSTSPINASNWAVARQVAGEPAPLPAGTPQSMVVTGLAANTAYYFAIQTLDEVPNGSALSNIATAQSLPDVIPPAAVADLHFASTASDTVTLAWTAPGDDGTVGTATSYDIRYSTNTINEGNWAAATPVTGEPVPTAALTSQSLVVTGLIDDTTYYFAIKAADEVGNISALSNVATTHTPEDDVPPAAVANLAITKPKSSTVTLTWAAPGDDGNSGTAASYDIRYSTSTINDGNWASAVQVTGVPVPAVAGTAQKAVVRNLRSQTTYYFAMKTTDEVGNVSALSNVPTGQTTDRSLINRPVLSKDDFEYLGAFLVPYYADEWNTSFNGAGLAVRRVNGELRIITGGHRQESDPIYEMTFPGWGNEWGEWPQAVVTNVWGTAVYGTPSMKEAQEGSIWTHGLLYDEATNRLYFSYASGYNVAQQNEPSLGYAVLEPSGPVAHGPWKAAAEVGITQRIRGGTLKIPTWFADAYLGGRTLGLGFGGPYSGNAACSQGPFLAAAYPPNDSTTQLDAVQLIDHPIEHWGTRDAGYWSLIPWCPSPVDGVGFWTIQDRIYGSCIWIDLPDKQGLLVGSLMAYGQIWYEGGKVGCESESLTWWVYDPAELAAVAQGQKQPWEPYRESWLMPYGPITNGEPFGFAFDAQTRTLFAIGTAAYNYGPGWYPLVYGWHIKESPIRLVGDINDDGFVNVGDLQALVAAWGSQAGPPASANWNVNADINEDDFVNVGDLQLLVAHWGEHL